MRCTGYRGHVTPKWELQRNLRLTYVNAYGISELRGRAANMGGLQVSGREPAENKRLRRKTLDFE